jgi:hypothetical protein
MLKFVQMYESEKVNKVPSANYVATITHPLAQFKCPSQQTNEDLKAYQQLSGCESCAKEYG